MASSSAVQAVFWRVTEFVTAKFTREHLRGKYHCMVDLLCDWFRNVRLCTTKFSDRSTEAHFQTSQTGGQQYSDTSPLSVPLFTDSKTVELYEFGHTQKYDIDDWSPR